MAKNNTYVYIILVVILIIVIGLFVWAGVLYSNFKKCESSESPYCPQLFCDTPHPKCGNNAYRVDDSGEVVCAEFLITQNAPRLETVPSAIGGGGN